MAFPTGCSGQQHYGFFSRQGRQKIALFFTLFPLQNVTMW